MLKLVRLERYADRMSAQLSGGQQQRVALARALAMIRPSLLMDKPLSALEKKLREEIQFEIKRIHNETGVTILYVTHDQEEALRLSDRIALFNHGRIEQVGWAETSTSIRRRISWLHSSAIPTFCRRGSPKSRTTGARWFCPTELSFKICLHRAWQPAPTSRSWSGPISSRFFEEGRRLRRHGFPLRWSTRPFSGYHACPDQDRLGEDISIRLPCDALAGNLPHAAEQVQLSWPSASSRLFAKGTQPRGGLPS